MYFYNIGDMTQQRNLKKFTTEKRLKIVFEIINCSSFKQSTIRSHTSRRFVWLPPPSQSITWTSFKHKMFYRN